MRVLKISIALLFTISPLFINFKINKVEAQAQPFEVAIDKADNYIENELNKLGVVKQTNATKDDDYEIFIKKPTDLIAISALENVAEEYTHEFKTPVNSFNIEAENLTTLTFKAEFNDGTITEYLKINEFEGAKDDSPEPTGSSSQLFYFLKQVSKLHFLRKPGQEIKVNVVSSEIKSVVGKQATTETTTLKKKFFTNIGINIVTREEWGAPATSPWGPSYPDLVNRIVVHHTATSPNYSDPAAAVRAIYNFHFYRCANNSGSYDPGNPNCDEQNELWEDIGYNYLIDQNGKIYEGRAGGNGVIGAHSPPNWGTIGIGLIGNFQTQEPSYNAQQSLTKLIAALSDLNEIELSWHNNVYGHRDRNGTACPGEVVYERIPGILSISRSIGPKSNLSSALDITKKQFAGGDSSYINPKEDYSELLIDNSTLTSAQRTFILSKTADENTKNINGYTIFNTDKYSARRFVTEINLISPGVIAQPNFKYEKLSWDNSDPDRSIPSDYDASTHWNLEKIKASEAWKDLGGCSSDTDCGGDSAVNVAVIDTGVAYEDFNFDAGQSYTLRDFGQIQMDIPGNSTADGVYNEGYDRQYDQAPELADTTFSNAYDAAWDFLCDFVRSAPYQCNSTELAKIDHANDDDGHGTFVTTIIAGRTGDTAPNRVVGIAHNVSIIPIKAFFPNDSSFCYDSNGNNDASCLPGNSNYSLRGVGSTFLLTLAINHAVANGADVINMSLGGTGYDQSVQNAINAAADTGVITVAASGNNGLNINFYPAAMNNVISVGSSTTSDTRATYSNYGSTLDLVAPVGTTIASVRYSCTAGDTCYQENSDKFTTANFTSNTSPATWSGTSFASPQVAAAAALLKSINPNIQQDDVETLIMTTATDILTPGRDTQTGYGILNVEGAVSHSWSSWQLVNGVDDVVYGSVKNVQYNGKVYQFASTSSKRVVMRNTSDLTTWTDWVEIGGKTDRDIGVAVFDNGVDERIYISVIGTSGNVFTKTMNSSEVFDASWNSDDLVSNNGISMASMQIGGEDRLYQVVTNTADKIQYRYTLDGVFDDSVPAESWDFANGKASSTPEISSFNTNLIIAVGGSTKRIFTLSSSDGVIDNEVFTLISGKTTLSPNLFSENNKIQITVAGSTSNGIFNSLSSDYSTWTGFSTINGKTFHKIDTLFTDITGTDTILQLIRGKYGQVYFRQKSINNL